MQSRPEHSEKPPEEPETTKLSSDLRSRKPKDMSMSPPLKPPPSQPPLPPGKGPFSLDPSPGERKDQSAIQLKRTLFEPPSSEPPLPVVKSASVRPDRIVKRRKVMDSANIGNSQLTLQFNEVELSALKCLCGSQMPYHRMTYWTMTLLRKLNKFGTCTLSRRLRTIANKEDISLFLDAIEMFETHERNFSSSDICVLYTGTEGALEGALVHSKAGFSYYQKAKSCPRCWIIMDGHMRTTSNRLSVSKIFDLAFEAVVKDEDIDKSLCRMILHTASLSKCDTGEHTCYNTFVKSSTNYYGCEKNFLGSTELKKLFPFALDKPISLAMILRIFKVSRSLGSSFVESRKIKIPFSFKEGFMHIGKEGRLSESAMEVILDLKDEVLVGTKLSDFQGEFALDENKNVKRNQLAEVLSGTSSLGQSEELNIDSETLQSPFRTDTTGSEAVSEACQYIQCLGLAKAYTPRNILIGPKEIKERLAEMGVPGKIANLILFREYTGQDGPEISSTGDILAVQIAEFIRSCKSTYNRPILLGAETRSGLSRFSRRKRFYCLDRSGRGALSRFPDSHSCVGNLLLNIGVMKARLSLPERVQNEHDIPSTPKLSEYVAAIANVELTCRIEYLDDDLKTRIWVDRDNSPEFQAACLIALSTLDPSVLLVGDFPSIEDAAFRTARGLPKDGKCILDIPVSQFIYTLDDLKITSLQPMPKKFLVYGEYNITEKGNVYVGRAKRTINATSSSSSTQ